MSTSRRGRPRKFTRPSRAITVTLPDDVIAALRTIDGDLSHAIARVAAPLIATTPPARATEVVRYGDRAVIVVPRNRALLARAGVELIPFADGRALIAFDDLSASQLELRLGDALTDPGLTGGDRTLFEELASILRNARRADASSVQQRSIIVLHSARRRSRSLEPRSASA